MKKLLVLGLSILSMGFIFAKTSIGDIELRFCDVEDASGAITEGVSKTLSLDMDQGEEKDICMVITNNGNDDVKLKLNFVDGTVTNDQFQHKACKNESENSNFGQFVIANKEPFEVPAGASVEKHAVIKFPEGFGGTTLGCVTYFMANSLETTNDNMFKVMVRKANFIQAVVSGTMSFGVSFIDLPEHDLYKNLSHNPKIGVYYDMNKDKTFIHFGLRNMGSIPENVVITGVIENMFGYKQVFVTDSKQILAKEAITIREEIEGLPFYKGPFKVSLNVGYKPALNFDSVNISDDMKDGGSIYTEDEIFILSWAMIAIVVGVFVLIAIIIKLNRKHHEKKKKLHAKKKATRHAAEHRAKERKVKK